MTEARSHIGIVNQAEGPHPFGRLAGQAVVQSGLRIGLDRSAPQGLCGRGYGRHDGLKRGNWTKGGPSPAVGCRGQGLRPTLGFD